MAERKTIIAVILVMAAISLLCLSSCRTTSGSEHDQIVRTAIDLANTYLEAGQPEKALDVYDRALEQADDYRLYFNKALILSDIGRNSEAAELCRTSFEKYPHIIAFKKAQAEFLYLSGNTGAAFEAYMEELELNPYDTETRKTLIDRLMESGQSTAAYEQALIMWNQGYKDKDTVTYLYSVRPDIWQNVYTLINPKPKTPDPAPGQEPEEKEEKSE
ncbi:MAG: tetratricopeptide repeat protein [Spirochaetales bacterium]|nr:tetratricopeptide repeat protein [Spirochaetales bacterium]